MRVPSKAEQEPLPPEVPMEVQIWLDKGWTIIPAKRRGLVLAGQKKMRGIDKAGFVIGLLLVLAFFVHYPLLGALGLLLIAGAWCDFKFWTKPPTKFFPEPGEKTRVMERK